jgi:ATP-binding protein involved in chromosome partitioning
MGFLVEEDSAMIWRGPMIMGAVQQFLGQVEWGELDVLVVDLPPGTGDIQLTLSQRVKVTGAVIVSTPQDIALIDARRAVRMFEKVEIPIFGVIENMSVFCCPNCGHRSEIFGHGGARQEAARLGQTFLGEIPLLLDVRHMSDAGTPIVAAAPDSEGAKAFEAIADTLAARLSLTAAVSG